MDKINMIREIRELKNQLSYSKNIGFFFGAGTSCALNIPNIEQLTAAVEGKLVGDFQIHFKAIKSDLVTTITDRVVNIEDILSHIRRIREITSEKDFKEYLGIKGDAAKKLDNEICKYIYDILVEKENEADIENTKRFFAWLSMINQGFSKEIFTTNYDLIIEKSLEANGIPYFDGFVGSYEPFFWQESIDKFVVKDDLTQNWIRLWKIHGSLSWFWKEDSKTSSQRIIRIGKVENLKDQDNELVIYPSKEKYDLSKKQPFIAYFDRLKNYLLNGELLFVFSGYSFSDQHINEVIFTSLRQNSRLTVLVFFFQDSEVEKLHKQIPIYMNLNIFGPKKAIINGNIGEWEYKSSDLKPNEKSDLYWDEQNSKLLLGDFNYLVNFLIANSGQKDAVELVAK